MLQPRFKKGETVFYVHIPATKDLITGKAKADKARPARSMVEEHYWPHQGSGYEIIYKLFAGGKKVNQSALFGEKDACQVACDLVNADLAKAIEAKPRRIDKPEKTDKQENMALGTLAP